MLRPSLDRYACFAVPFIAAVLLFDSCFAGQNQWSNLDESTAAFIEGEHEFLKVKAAVQEFEPDAVFAVVGPIRAGKSRLLLKIAEQQKGKITGVIESGFAVRGLTKRLAALTYSSYTIGRGASRSP